MAWIGLDIGGANLKAAFPNSPDRPALEMRFPMWTDWQQLEAAIGKLVAAGGAADRVAVTMTGELADCFASRREGVLFIADAIERVCKPRRVFYYSCDGRWLNRLELDAGWDLVAAANWHATARWGARLLPEQTGWGIDVGSTTTDISFVEDGVVRTASQNDLQRLITGELTYVGGVRTPVCGLIDHVDHDGVKISLANELFATISDAAVWRRLLPEMASDIGTADGRPRTIAASGQRLARMLCRDLADLDSTMIDAVADQAIAAAQNAIRVSLVNRASELNQTPGSMLILGEGHFLLDRWIESLYPGSKIVQLSGEVNSEVSACGPAHAVAVLASEDLA